MFENTKYGKYVFTTDQPLHTNINRNTQFIKSRKFLKFSQYVRLTRDVDHAHTYFDSCFYMSQDIRLKITTLPVDDQQDNREPVSVKRRLRTIVFTMQMRT